jgi:hypothetical protein
MKKLLVYIHQKPASLKAPSDEALFQANIARLPSGAAWMETSISRLSDAPPYDPDKVTIK